MLATPSSLYTFLICALKTTKAAKTIIDQAAVHSATTIIRLVFAWVGTFVELSCLFVVAPI